MCYFDRRKQIRRSQVQLQPMLATTYSTEFFFFFFFSFILRQLKERLPFCRLQSNTIMTVSIFYPGCWHCPWQLSDFWHIWMWSRSISSTSPHSCLYSLLFRCRCRWCLVRQEPATRWLASARYPLQSRPRQEVELESQNRHTSHLLQKYRVFWGRGNE
jgi:hypothetical protein